MRVVLLDIGEKMPDLWRRAIGRRRVSGVDVVVFKGQLPQLGAYLRTVNRTSIVSPGNSAGFMGGGFDKSLASFFRQGGDWKVTEMHVRLSLKGYVPLGTANLVKFDAEFYKTSPAWTTLRASSIIHVPTMRAPQKLWDGSISRWRGFVFDCVWAVLVEVEAANKRDSSQIIDTIVIPSLGTGYGELPQDLVADAMVAAITIFFDDIGSDEKTFAALEYVDGCGKEGFVEEI
ncbi:unnamed protein product [Kuraishia capsulata CBS 1993]|uniref:Macro domain-containing protein n=1 Tax=Kuraishia capsulata CBS 1993 TaxID=1382522 RepID=W6MG63_9ASCO|nr:uncharacterized protein KUCA_T00000697001 [Kuraishia capsulata CBS 1993]CDK24731.1 unnamed protein product [Kuraishia capsulata CBS 1993]